MWVLARVVAEAVVLLSGKDGRSVAWRTMIVLRVSLWLDGWEPRASCREASRRARRGNGCAGRVGDAVVCPAPRKIFVALLS